MHVKNGRARKVYKPEIIENYRELLDRVTSKYKNNVAYKYKKSHQIPKYRKNI